MDNIYKVYVKADSNNCITGVESTAFYDEQELIEKGFIYIDEGSSGEIYGHAQPNYLLKQYGEPCYDDQCRCNYKLIDLKPVILTEDEKQILFPKHEQEPSELDRLKEQQERTDAAVQDLILMIVGGE